MNMYTAPWSASCPRWHLAKRAPANTELTQPGQGWLKKGKKKRVGTEIVLPGVHHSFRACQWSREDTEGPSTMTIRRGGIGICGFCKAFLVLLTAPPTSSATL